jgi:AAA domain
MEFDPLVQGQGSRQMSDEDLNVVPLRRRMSGSAFRVKWDTDISHTSREECMIKGLIPSQGFGVLYGRSQSFKSFLALDMAYHVALGRKWAGRRVTQGVAFYVAAEGMAGMSKRVEGFRKAHGNWPGNVPFALVPAAPNLGSPKGDLQLLIDSIESTGKTPSLLVLDTLSQMLCGAEENGTGMTAFIRNAQALSNHFGCFVLAIHHVGLGDDKSQRLRGHSSLHAAVDTQILCEQLPDGYSSALTVQKVKDGASDLSMTAYLRRLVLGADEDGEEVSTLVVDRIEDGVAPRAERRAKQKQQAKLPAGASTALAAIKTATKTYGITPEACEQIPAGIKVVTLDNWRDQAFKAGICGSDDEQSKKKAFERAYGRLMDEGKIKVWNGLAWAA